MTEDTKVEVARVAERLEHVIERVRDLEHEVSDGYAKLWRISWIVMLLLVTQVLSNVGLSKLVAFLK